MKWTSHMRLHSGAEMDELLNRFHTGMEQSQAAKFRILNALHKRDENLKHNVTKHYFKSLKWEIVREKRSELEAALKILVE